MCEQRRHGSNNGLSRRRSPTHYKKYFSSLSLITTVILSKFEVDAGQAFTPLALHEYSLPHGQANLGSLRGAIVQKQKYVVKKEMVTTFRSGMVNNDVLSNNGSSYVPHEFQDDSLVYSLSDPLYAPFPRWDFSKTSELSSTATSIGSMSMIDSIIEFVQHESEQFSNYPRGFERDGLSHWTHTSDHSIETINWWYPEILYVIDVSGALSSIRDEKQSTRNPPTIYGSARARDIADEGTNAIRHKFDPTEKSMNDAIHLLLFGNVAMNSATSSVEAVQHNQQYSQKNWPHLYEVLTKRGGSIPFLGYYGDYTGCAYQNWHNDELSLPIFTVAASLQCNHTIPFPNYRTSINSRTTSMNWASRLKKLAETYPSYSNKISKVVWRGSLTGKFSKDGSVRSPRYHLLKFVHSNDTNVIIPSERDLFDFKLTSIPKMTSTNYPYIDEDELGGTGKQQYIDFADQQNYKAILDIDGHSWSSRFGATLCLNSVLLKVEPEYVDYFYYPSQRRGDMAFEALQPWKHYIPIRKDLSDLVAKTKYVMDPQNDEHVTAIINNADEWCQKRMTHNAIAHDMLDVWESYVTMLDTSSTIVNTGVGMTASDDQRPMTSWENRWKEAKENFFRTGSSLEMIPLQNASSIFE